MCGIAGCYFNEKKNFFKNFELIKKISISLNHRGPDNMGYFYDKERKIILSHNRLAILDLSKKASQPFISSSNNLIISYNGEIYNHLKIREFLRKKKFHIDWKTSSDTETLIECIDKIGIDKTLKKICGMFSFALWDKKKGCLYLVRDRFGEKPLYFFEHNKSFFFSSEIGQLDKLFKDDLKLDQKSINSFLNYNYIPDPYSIYQSVKKVSPGTYLKVNLNKSKIIITKKNYWKPGMFISKNNFFYKKNNEYIHEFEKILFNVVEDVLISDVPTGIFLSSGVDSTLIASIANKISKKKINTFSLGVKNDNDFNELKEAEKIANHFGFNHHSFEISEKKIIDNIEDALNCYDEPFADSSQILTYLLCKESRQHIKVALTGDGGDELFGGYNRHLIIYYLEKNMKLLNINSLENDFLKKIINNIPLILTPSLLQKFFAYGFDKHKKIKNISKYSSEDNLYQMLISNNNETKIDSLLSSVSIRKNIFHGKKTHNFLIKMMLSDIKNYLPNDLLVKIDRSSMAFGLECRAPLLDLRVYNFAKKLPNNLRFKNLKNKFFLREILKNHIPKNIFSHKKKGFSFSLKKLFQQKYFKSWSQTLLSEQMIKKNRFLNHDKIIQLIQLQRQGKSDYSNTLWSLIVLQNWLKKRNFFN